MLVSFWAMDNGQSASTTNMLAMSLALSLKYKLKTLVTHTKYGETRLENSLLKDLDTYTESAISGYGLGPLIRLQKNGLLNSENYTNYTIPLIRDMRYDLLIGAENQHLELGELESYEKTLLNVLELAGANYDMVFVDVSSGEENRLSKKLLDMSDIIVANMNQSTYSIDRVVNSKLLDGRENVLYCLGRYEDKIKASRKNIERRYKLKNLLTVPYNPMLIDVINNGSILEYFGRNIIEDKKIKSEFFKTILQSAEIIEKFKYNR